MYGLRLVLLVWCRRVNGALRLMDMRLSLHVCDGMCTYVSAWDPPLKTVDEKVLSYLALK